MRATPKIAASYLVRRTGPLATRFADWVKDFPAHFLGAAKLAR
jgi:hypothetical protein